MIFNLNDIVIVRLTVHGRAYHAAQHALFNAQTGKSITYVAPIEDGHGMSKWPLWLLMHTFGNVLFPGNLEMPFDINIGIPGAKVEPAAEPKS